MLPINIFIAYYTEAISSRFDFHYFFLRSVIIFCQNLML